ncbi:uncharacterized protein LOC117341380 isoform X2 [Pecten maximus]|uniref:uncharacterized protein LOC117341380 isoform X2 n=1 Tax=Pecten maximus TaxID=6579 RepID=UPI00145847C5|nr:uncharacterized protein LOC117341380 isoform X2 [Pecten maximus]
MTVFPFPNVESVYYSVGSSLTFTCTGTVGSDKKTHKWCYKRATDQGYTGYSTAADINQNDNGLIQSGCNYQRTSTLTYNVTNEDTNTTFMCEPFTGTVCGSNPASLITYKSIRRYSPGRTTGGQGDTGDKTTTTASTCVPSIYDVTPWIVVAVIFIMATVVLSTTVAFLCRKVLEYKERLHQSVNYEVVNRGFSRNDEHVYNTTDNYEIPQI